jgi:hypothetical protein
MNRIAAFAQSTFREAMRNKILYTILLIACGLRPAAAERLVVSLSNHRVAVTSSFVGEDLSALSQKGVPSFGERHLACRAGQKRGFVILLQVSYHPRDRTLLNSQLSRRR